MLTQIFPINIYKTKIHGVETALDQIMPKVKPIFEGLHSAHPDFSSGVTTTFNVNNKLHEDESFKDIVEQLNVCIADCWKQFKFYRGLDPFISECWMNRNSTGSEVIAHNHAPYVLAGVLYLKADKDMGNLVFENPNSLVASMQPYDYQRPEDVPEWLETSIEIQTGDLILFPGWLRHKTRKNNTNDYRYAVSFNVGCKGSDWMIANREWDIRK